MHGGNMLIKRKKEVFLTSNAEQYGKIQSVLNKADISFETKVINTGSQNRRTGEFWGKFGENTNIEILYYIYVSPKDEEKAKYIINEYQRNTSVHNL